MKVAFCLFKYFPFGGLQRDFLAIAEECLKRDYEVDVYTLQWQGEVPKGFNVKILDVPGIMNHTRYKNFSNYILKQQFTGGYDLVIGFNKMRGLDVYFAADPCYLERTKTLKSKFYRLMPRFHSLRAMEQCVFSQASNTQILALTKSQIVDFQCHYHTPSERFAMIPAWIKGDRRPHAGMHQQAEKIRAEFTIKDGEKLLLFVGSGFQTKGLDRALRAVQSLSQEQQKKIHFLIVGHDKIEPFKNYADKLKLKARVEFLGGRQDIPDFLFAADLLLHPAYSESAGIVLLEATIAGTPVLTTAACGYAEHIQAANSGVVLPEPFSQQQLNNELQQLLFTQDLRSLGNNGIAYGKANDFYSMPEKIVDKFVEYQKVKQQSFIRNKNMMLRGELLTQGLNSFDTIINLQGQIYRQVKNRRTLKFGKGNKDYFLKVHQGVGWLEIVKNLLSLRLPILGAKNEKLAIEKLQQIGIETMTLAGYGKRGCNPANQQSFLMTEALDDTISLEDYCADWGKCSPDFTEKKQLIEKIAKITRQMHQHGINHRDYYICHFLAKKNNILQLYLIDLHRVQIRERVPQRWLIKDLGSLYFSVLDLGLSKKDILRFLKHYTNNNLKRTLTDKLWYNVNQRARFLYHKAFQKSVQLPLGDAS